jgi:hypothetical protein
VVPFEFNKEHPVYIHTQGMDLTADLCTATFSDLLCMIPGLNKWGRISRLAEELLASQLTCFMENTAGS